MKSQRSICGLLLAAGRGRRMGGTKQLLPWPTPKGEVPLVAASFDAIASWCESMVVVVGHEAGDVVAGLGDRIFDVVEVDPDAEMLESVRAGLEPIRRTGLHDAVLLQLGDHPIVSEATIHSMLTAGDSIAVIPEYDGRGGHPVLIPVGLLDEIIAFTGAGLRAYWETTERIRRLPVEDPWIRVDLDSPEAYEQARKRATR